MTNEQKRRKGEVSDTFDDLLKELNAWQTETFPSPDRRT